MTLSRIRAAASRTPRWRTALGVTLTATCMAALADGTPTVADTVYRDGVVYTVDATGTVAQAIAIADGRIVYVGSDEGVKPLVDKKTRVVDLHGHMVMPGLIDGHMHPVAAGIDLLKCNLNYELLTVTEFQRRIQACADKRQGDTPDAWLEVVNWFRYGMTPKDVAITRVTLDALRTQRPIVVHDSFGHSSLANSKALQLAKITANSKAPAGGRIDRDAAGAPTGILEDSAQELVNSLLPKPTAKDYVAGARAALDALRHQGVTTFLDAIGTDEDIEAMAALEHAGELTARAHFAPLVRPAEVPDPEAARRAVTRVVAVAKKYDEGTIRPTPSLTVHNVKLFMDGVINAPANTAALLEPYFENHGTEKAPKFEPAARREPDVYFQAPILKELLIGFGQAGIDPHLHTDGDWAVRAALDGVKAMRTALPGRDIRPGFAHCELVDPADYPRFQELNVTPVLSFQWEKPASDTIEGAIDSLGPKRYPYIEAAGYIAAKGARIAYGSDWPVDPLDEWFALQVGVTRRARPDAPPRYAGRLGNDPGLSQAAVIKAITLNAAYELHEDKYIGSLEVGKLADLIVLDRNVSTIPPDQIAVTKVLRTVVGGRVVYDTGELAKLQ
jgi:predicted amidohydrolase YtcJ